MPKRPSRTSTSSLHLQKSKQFIHKRDCTLYLFLLLAFGLTSLLIASFAIFVTIDDFPSSLQVLFGVQAFSLVSEIIVIFFLIFTLCRRRVNALTFLLGAINYAVLLPILIFGVSQCNL